MIISGPQQEDSPPNPNRKVHFNLDNIQDKQRINSLSKITNEYSRKAPQQQKSNERVTKGKEDSEIEGGNRDKGSQEDQLSQLSENEQPSQSEIAPSSQFFFKRAFQNQFSSSNRGNESQQVSSNLPFPPSSQQVFRGALKRQLSSNIDGIIEREEKEEEEEEEEEGLAQDRKVQEFSPPRRGKKSKTPNTPNVKRSLLTQFGNSKKANQKEGANKKRDEENGGDEENGVNEENGGEENGVNEENGGEVEQQKTVSSETSPLKQISPSQFNSNHHNNLLSSLEPTPQNQSTFLFRNSNFACSSSQTATPLNSNYIKSYGSNHFSQPTTIANTQTPPNFSIGKGLENLREREREEKLKEMVSKLEKQILLSQQQKVQLCDNSQQLISQQSNAISSLQQKLEEERKKRNFSEERVKELYCQFQNLKEMEAPTYNQNKNIHNDTNNNHNLLLLDSSHSPSNSQSLSQNGVERSSQHKQMVEVLERRCQALEETVNQLTKEKGKMEKRKKKLCAKLGEITVRADQVKTEIQNKELQIIELKQNYQLLSSECENQRIEAQQLSSQVLIFQQNLSTCNSEKEEAFKLNETLKQELEKLSKENKNLLLQLSKQNSNNNNNNESSFYSQNVGTSSPRNLENWRVELEKMHQQNNELTLKVHSLSEKLNTECQKYTFLREEYDKLENLFNKEKQILESICNSNQIQIEQFSLLKQKNKDLSLQIFQLEQQLEQHKNPSSSIVGKNKQEEELKAANELLSCLREEKESLLLQISSLQNEHNLQVQLLQQNLEREKEKMQIIHSNQIHSLNSLFECKEKTHLLTIQNLNNNISLLEKAYHTLEKQLSLHSKALFTHKLVLFATFFYPLLAHHPLSSQYTRKRSHGWL